MGETSSVYGSASARVAPNSARWMEIRPHRCQMMALNSIDHCIFIYFYYYCYRLYNGRWLVNETDDKLIQNLINKLINE